MQAADFNVQMDQTIQTFYLMTFYTTTHTMQVYKNLKGLFDVVIMPVPREISASCGLAIKFCGDNRDAFRDYFDHLDFPSRLFCLDEERRDGKRSVSLIAEHLQNHADL